MTNKLKEFREQKGWTQEKLSEMSGVTRQTINTIENNPSYAAILSTTMMKLSKALDCKTSDIFLL